MIKFKNRKTGKIIRLMEGIDVHLIEDMRKNKDYKEMMNL